MGLITIQTSGSFQSPTKTFRADHHGHAEAVAQAIEWLVGEVLPESTAQDHELHDAGDWPAGGPNSRYSVSDR